MDGAPELNGNTPERLSFDSDLHPAHLRLDRYREINGAGVSASDLGPDFRVRLERWRLDRVVLHERHLNDVQHIRTEAHARTDGVDHFVIHIVRSGSYQVDAGAGLVSVPPPSIILVDMAQPMQSRSKDAHILTVSMARGLVAEALGSTRDLHGKVLTGNRVALFVDFALALAGRVNTLPPDMVHGTTRALIALLAAATGDLAEHERPEVSEADAARLDRARGVIEQRLSDPMLGPDALVTATGLSRATLYRLFQPRGGLMAYIQRRRLDRVRVALSRKSERRSLAAIASDSGFLSESHCSRQFVSAFGIRPGEYRAEILDAAGGADERRVDYWVADLR
jgi:AraC-like DNA-binding protein